MKTKNLFPILSTLMQVCLSRGVYCSISHADLIDKEYDLDFGSVHIRDMETEPGRTDFNRVYVDSGSLLGVAGFDSRGYDYVQSVVQAVHTSDLDNIDMGGQTLLEMLIPTEDAGMLYVKIESKERAEADTLRPLS